MSIAKFRKIRLVIVILLWLIVSIISSIKAFTSYNEISVGSAISCLSEPCVFLLILLVVHLGLKKLFPNGTIKNNRYANVAVDMLIYIVASVVTYCVLIVLYCGFVYLLCELGYAPAPQ